MIVDVDFKDLKYFDYEDFKLLKSAFKSLGMDSKGRGIDVSDDDAFLAYLRTLEINAETTHQVYCKRTDSFHDIPFMRIRSVKEGIILLSLNVTGPQKPYISIDMIATRNGSPKELLHLIKLVREEWYRLPCKLPIEIETVDIRIAKRVFDKKLDEVFKDIVMFKVRETYIIDLDTEKGE
jgi:hypothetical protein